MSRAVSRQLGALQSTSALHETRGLVGKEAENFTGSTALRKSLKFDGAQEPPRPIIYLTNPERRTYKYQFLSGPESAIAG